MLWSIGGVFMTGRILYGYQIEKGIAVVEQTERLYVQKLFDDYINGIPQYKLLPELIQYAEKNNCLYRLSNPVI